MKTIESGEVDRSKADAWKVGLLVFFIMLVLSFGVHWIAKTRESTESLVFFSALMAALNYAMNRRDWFD